MARLESLVKPLEKMSDAELLAMLQEVRHRREVSRPVAQRKAASAEKKASNKRTSNLTKMLEGMSEVEREALMKQLESGE